MHFSDFNESSLVVGCNYHTKWQRHKGMRFVLESVEGDVAVLHTRVTKKRFKTKVSDLIFITSNHNIRKAITIKNKQAKQ